MKVVPTLVPGKRSPAELKNDEGIYKLDGLIVEKVSNRKSERLSLPRNTVVRPGSLGDAATLP